MAREMDPDATPVHAVMTPYFASVDASCTVDVAMRAARSCPAHVLAVTDGGEVVGLVTAEEVLREAATSS
jgi:signal-transduction protein with cAMP-binding, CBS, and nucleotidyltransferase domain